jgi:transposase-like protein
MKTSRRETDMAARRERWRRVVSEVEGSGQPIREYCRAHGIKENLFYRWRQVLELEDRQAGADGGQQSGFVLVRPEGEAGTESEFGGLELVLDRGWRLRIAGGVEESTLRLVLRVLAGCS